MLTVTDVMQSNPVTVSEDLPLLSLEQRFVSTGFSGFPVVRGATLVGVVSRSDLIRGIAKGWLSESPDAHASQSLLESGRG